MNLKFPIIKISLVIVLLLGLIFFGVLPLWQENSQLNQELTAQSQQLQTIPSKISILNIDAYLKEQSKKLPPLTALIHSSDNELSLFYQLENLADQHKIEAKLQLAGPRQKAASGLETMNLNLDLNGKKTNVLSFVTSLEQQPGLRILQGSLSNQDENSASGQLLIQTFWQ